MEDFQDAMAQARRLYASTKAQADREGRDFTASESATLQRHIDEAEALKKRVSVGRSEQSFMTALEGRTNGLLDDTRGGALRGSTLGAQFARASGDWLRDPKNRPTHGHWASPMVELDDPRFGRELRATTLTGQAGSGGALIVPQYLPGIVEVLLRKNRVADLLASGTASEPLITYMQQTSYTNAAAAVAEGASKPESAMVFTQVQEAVSKIAHFIPVTEEMLEDVDQLRAFIDAQLISGIDLTEEDQLLNGNGTAPNLKGILNRTGLAPDWPRGTDSNPDAILKAIAALEQQNPGVTVSGIIMNQANWTPMMLLKTTTNEYIGGSPFQPVMTPSLWGRPVVQTPAMVVGTALLVCKEQALVLRRGGIRLDASNSHQDFFIKNLVAIRAEERIALAVLRPSCFGKVTGLS
jgi:HK97 family phage major capsid protein